MTNPGKINKAERNARYLQGLMEQGTIRDVLPDPEETLDANKSFLIICEGANTEKYYFESFPVVSSVVKVIGGYGGGKLYLVKSAVAIADKAEYEGFEVWCVFDYDVKLSNTRQKEDFDNAISLAQQKGFNVAFSNDCFELWFLLHSKFIQSQHHRQEYFEMLTDIWKNGLGDAKYEDYGKSVKGCSNIYSWLLPYQKDAIANATRLHDAYQGVPFHQMNPCTTVHKLVQELNKYLRN